MIDLPLLPHGRLNRDELHGFNLACACMITWGQMLANSPVRLGGAHFDAPVANDGHRLASMARALHLTIGQNKGT